MTSKTRGIHLAAQAVMDYNGNYFARKRKLILTLQTKDGRSTASSPQTTTDLLDSAS
jgi:hypothetical protein